MSSKPFKTNRKKKVVHFNGKRNHFALSPGISFPESIKFNKREAFFRFLSNYENILLKPTSNHSSPTFQVLKDEKGSYKVLTSEGSFLFANKEGLFTFLTSKIKTSYLIQQYIPFLQLKNRPFSLKIKVEKRPEGNWDITEKYVKVKSIPQQETDILSVKETFSLLNLPLETLISLDENIIKVVKKLEKKAPRYPMWEISIGIDEQKKLWVTKANSKPLYIKEQKQNVYTVLKSDESLQLVLPQTNVMNSEEVLWNMLDEHKTIILKPVFGRSGSGVIKVSVQPLSYLIQYRNENKQFLTKKEAFTFLQTMIENQTYLVQQYIDLATIEGRPLDLRIIVQRNEHSEWIVTGKYAKVASLGYFTTNLATDADVLSIEEAVEKSGLGHLNITKLLQDLDSIALKTAGKLGDISLHQRIWGLDVGIDQKGRIFIIEVNSRPGTKGFRKLKNLDMYKTIRRYKKL
jgi:glutathione synthase/RimK-type ligase-like ATP-grasp enzyme